MKHTPGVSQGAFRAARAILEKVHFGSQCGDDAAGSRHPANAAFLDHRAAELAYIVDRETSAPELLEACKAALKTHRMERQQIFGTDALEEELRAAIAKAEGRDK